MGYDKYSELTSEHAIRGTYCDLAVQVEGRLKFLIEVKAVGVELKEAHIKQASDYGANQGVEFVVLTNGLNWMLFNLKFQKPIDRTLIEQFNFLTIDPKRYEDILKLFVLAKEGMNKSALEQFMVTKNATDKFSIAASLFSDPVVKQIRRLLKKVHPDAKVTDRNIVDEMRGHIIKRDIADSAEFKNSAKEINRYFKKRARKQKQNEAGKDEHIEICDMTEVRKIG